MQKILFVRNFKPRSDGNLKISGGHIKIRDYFLHCLHHPELDPHLYFTPGSEFEGSEVWQPIPREKIVREIDVDDYQVIFLTDKDLRYLPKKQIKRKKVINLMQTLRACSPDYPVYVYVKKPAYRIFVSPDIFEAGRHFPTYGEPFIIPNGIPLDLFKPGPKRENAILIWAKKNPDLGDRIFQRLKGMHCDVTLLKDYLPREEFARRLRTTDVFVTCPWVRESFHLPAIEGMASGCAVVTSDNVGNRSFCIHGETCLMTEFDRVDQYIDMITLLFENKPLKEKIRQGGLKKAASYSLSREREDFFRFLEKNIL